MAQTTFSGPVLEGKEGVNIETKTSNYTVTTGDSGKTFVSSTDGVVFTLPAIAIGYSFKFVNNAPDGANALTLSPNASDGITYAGSSTDDKDLINTKATSKQGDFVVISSLDGTGAWQVTQVRGTFAKES
jgi:hypothetical protein|tara:strand:- start:111 stop:500 length:390 start_codon:yes stop_codon:yes gene_type:complete